MREYSARRRSSIRYNGNRRRIVRSFSAFGERVRAYGDRSRSRKRSASSRNRRFARRTDGAANSSELPTSSKRLKRVTKSSARSLKRRSLRTMFAVSFPNAFQINVFVVLSAVRRIVRRSLKALVFLGLRTLTRSYIVSRGFPSCTIVSHDFLLFPAIVPNPLYKTKLKYIPNVIFC